MIVQEVLGPIPETDIQLETTDTCDMIAECAGKLTAVAFDAAGGEADRDFESMV